MRQSYVAKIWTALPRLFSDSPPQRLVASSDVLLLLFNQARYALHKSICLAGAQLDGTNLTRTPRHPAYLDRLAQNNPAWLGTHRRKVEHIVFFKTRISEDHAIE